MDVMGRAGILKYCQHHEDFLKVRKQILKRLTKIFWCPGTHFSPVIHILGWFSWQQKAKKFIYLSTGTKSCLHVDEKINSLVISTSTQGKKQTKKTISKRNKNLHSGPVKWLKMQWIRFQKCKPYSIHTKRQRLA